MDTTTANVRAMYEQFPYPSGHPTLRSSSSVRLLLSYVKKPRKAAGPLHALDAGCGRGIGTIGHAITNPDVNILGVDITKQALLDAEQMTVGRGIKNVRYQEIDLMTLEGLKTPANGFDVIYSSGVVHHMTDPRHGLTRLREVLAPHGVIALMVYARDGRHSLYRLARSLDVLAPRDRPLTERLSVGRALASAVKSDALTTGIWNDAASVADAEFVDRYLHVNETSYNVEELFTLLEGAGLRLLRWSSPNEWSVKDLLPAGEVRDRAMKLEPRDQYRLIEQLFWRDRHELLLCHKDNELRQIPGTVEELLKTAVAVSPEVSISSEVRILPGSQRVEKIGYRRRTEELVILTDSELCNALYSLRDQVDAFHAQAFVDILGSEGIPKDKAVRLLIDLLGREILYMPHLVDV